MIDFTADETMLLQQLVTEQLTELKTEINRTDSFEYKDKLRARRRLLEGIESKLSVPAREQPRVRGLDSGTISAQGDMVRTDAGLIIGPEA